MNILIISQCHKNALKETRRIVDQFAERTGDRTWQTPITQEGLKTLHRLLRQSARKNTAVACFWIRSRNVTELLWVVGDKKQFNEDGRTPTNRTQRNILREEDENQWHELYSIQIMSALGALLHDLGKATIGFDQKLREQSSSSDPYRHEWLSLCLFKNMIDGCQSNTDFLERLQNWQEYQKADPQWFTNLQVDEVHTDATTLGFENMPPLAQWLAWLIVSHHRLPYFDCNYNKGRKDLKRHDHVLLNADTETFFKFLKPVEGWVKSYGDQDSNSSHVKSFFKLKKDPTLSLDWQKELSRWSRKALANQNLLAIDRSQLISNPLRLHLSRLCLMLGDHNYSSLSADSSQRVLTYEQTKNYTTIAREDKSSKAELWANIDNSTQYGKQFLDEHLIGVSKMSAYFSRYLPHIKNDLNSLKSQSSLRRRSTNPRFSWQDKACDALSQYGKASEERGFFGINIASTGTGKTLGNAKIMSSLSSHKGSSRLTFALGLRVLTSQTGHALREHFKLSDENIATLIGGPVLTANTEDQNNLSGSESNDPNTFFDDTEFFDLIDEGAIDEDIFGTVIRDTKTKQLLMTPWISCTIDHLMQLTEQHRGGRYMAPLLRILSSDLILDEPDDFGTDDLPALSRLVFWTGLLGSRVMLSSATITHDMAVGLHKAYEAGRKQWASFLNQQPLPTVCAWFDEFNQHVGFYDSEDYAIQHKDFCNKRIKKLQQQPIRRKAEWLDFGSPKNLAQKLMEGALELHHRHGVEHTELLGKDKKLSIGLIRFANINPMMAVLNDFLKAECPEDTMFHVVPYHSQQLLLLRSTLEGSLDRLLQRSNENNLFLQPEIQAVVNHADHKHIKNHIFIVFGSPVTEVGRDHDYDWAIIEPSSMRSIIQLAGRVWRHRPMKVAETANILILNQNIKASQNQLPAYTRPGYESKDSNFKLSKHQLNHIIKEDEIEAITSIPRLQQEQHTAPAKKAARKQSRLSKLKGGATATVNIVKNELADLEHRVMQDLLNNDNNLISKYREEFNAACLSSHHSRISPFREEKGYTETYVALFDEYREYNILFKTYANAMSYSDNDENASTHKFKPLLLEHHERIQPWLVPNFQERLEEIAEQYDITLTNASLKFANVSLREFEEDSISRWNFHPWTGFWKEKEL